MHIFRGTKTAGPGFSPVHPFLFFFFLFAMFILHSRESELYRSIILHFPESADTINLLFYKNGHVENWCLKIFLAFSQTQWRFILLI